MKWEVVIGMETHAQLRTNSKIFSEPPSLKLLQLGQLLQASPSDCKFSQLIVLAKILAQVVFPTPRGPQNKNACAS